jgi:hypothetical protein
LKHTKQKARSSRKYRLRAVHLYFINNIRYLCRIRLDIFSGKSKREKIRKEEKERNKGTEKGEWQEEVFEFQCQGGERENEKKKEEYI